MNQPEYLTVNQAAAYIAVKPLTIRTWITKGLIKCHRIGRTIRIPKQALQEAIRETE